MKKSIAILLALLMMAGTLGCSSENAEEKETAQSDTTSSVGETDAQESETEEETEASVFAGIEEKKFDGRDFNFLYRTTEEYQFYAEEYTGDAINDAVHDRNLLVERTFDTKIVGIPIEGDWGQKDSYLNSMKKSIQANDGAYDLIDGYAAVIGGAYADGLMMNLHDVSNLRPTSTWWSQLAVNELTVNGKLFGIPGDLSLNLWKNIHVMFFNKTVLENNGLEKPYDMVKNGKWTYDKYLEMNVGVARDLDGNGEVSLEDSFGSIYYDDLSFDNFHNAFDYSYTVKNDDGSISLDLDEQIMVDTYEKIRSLAYENPDVYYNKGGKVEGTIDVFTQNRALFFASVLGDAEKMRDMNSDFGIIPFPKLSEAQEQYKTTSRDNRSMFCIPTDVKDADFAGLITEALCVASNRGVVPVYYDTVLKGKVARDSESAEMLDIIRSGLNFDFAAEFAIQTGRAGFILRDAIYYDKNYTTYYNESKKMFNKAFDRFVSYYMEEK